MTPPTDPDLMPVLETISASRRLPGWRRDWHALTATAGIAIVITMGALGGAGGRSRTPATLSPGDAPETARQVGSSLVGPASRDDPAALFTAAAVVVIEAATEPSVVRGSSVVVRGTAARPVGRSVVSVKLGASTLGRVVRVIGAGPFSIDIPVYSPNEPVGVDVVVRPDWPGAAPLAMRSLRLASSGAVETWSIVSARTGGRCRTLVDGPAPLTVGTVTARIVADGSDATSVVVPVTLDGAFDGGRLLGLGRWHAELDRPDPRTGGSDAMRLEIDWTDPIDGTHGTLMAGLPGCIVPAPVRHP
jgi:hypothetical protein